MPERHRRHFLKAKETKALVERVMERLKTDLRLLLNDKVDIEVFETDSTEIFLIKGKPLLFKAGEDIYPTLKFDDYFRSAPKVVVDMGAVPYVCKGADVMAPGIRRFEGRFIKNSIVFVVDERHGKPIAVGVILYDMEEVKNVKHGTAVKNIHYVGDRIWDQVKQLTSAA